MDMLQHLISCRIIIVIIIYCYILLLNQRVLYVHRRPSSSNLWPLPQQELLHPSVIRWRSPATLTTIQMCIKPRMMHVKITNYAVIVIKTS